MVPCRPRREAFRRGHRAFHPRGDLLARLGHDRPGLHGHWVITVGRAAALFSVRDRSNALRRAIPPRVIRLDEPQTAPCPRRRSRLGSIDNRKSTIGNPLVPPSLRPSVPADQCHHLTLHEKTVLAKRTHLTPPLQDEQRGRTVSASRRLLNRFSE